MIYKLRDDGQPLIQIQNIESIVVSDDKKSVAVFRNVLLNALTMGKIRPRNEYGFQVDLASHYQVDEDALEELTQKSVRAANRPRSITDFVRDVDPTEVKRLARLDMKRFNADGMKQAVLMCYLIKEDISGFLAEQRITYEWVSSESNCSEKLTNNELGMAPQSQPINSVEPRPTATTPLHDKQRRQEQAIVDELKMLGYNPKAFPKSRNGASGVRSEVRKRFVIGEGELFGTINTFRLAWERAILMGDIKSAE